MDYSYDIQGWFSAEQGEVRQMVWEGLTCTTC